MRVERGIHRLVGRHGERDGVANCVLVDLALDYETARITSYNVCYTKLLR